MHCCGAGTGCNDAVLASAERLTDFHDSELEEATRRINAILDRIRKTNQQPERQLDFCWTPLGLFLAWSTHTIGSDDAEKDVRKALGLTPAPDAQ